MKPFQHSILNLIDQPSDGWTIHWIHEPQGGLGKSKGLVPYLEEHKGALVIDPTAARDVKAAIRSHYESSERLAERPIIFLNIPRARSHEALKPKMYATLETIQDSYLDTKSGKSHMWEDGVYPHIFVTANVKPAVDEYIVGRLKVHFINTQDELVPDHLTQRKLDDYAERKREERIEYEKSLELGGETQRYLVLSGSSAGGAGGSGSISPEVKAAVVDELKELRTPEMMIWVLRDLIVKPTRKGGPTVGALSPSSLLHLGTDNEVAQAKNPRSHVPDPLRENLESCIDAAFPGSKFEDQPHKGRKVHGVVFNGRYVLLPQEE